MLTEMVITIFYNLIISILNLIPTFSLGSSFVSGIQGFANILNAISFIFPVGTLGIVLSLWFSFHLLEGGVSLVNWLIRKIPSIS